MYLDITSNKIGDDSPCCRRRGKIEGKSVVLAGVTQYGKLLGEINHNPDAAMKFILGSHRPVLYHPRALSCIGTESIAILLCRV